MYVYFFFFIAMLYFFNFKPNTILVNCHNIYFFVQFLYTITSSYVKIIAATLHQGQHPATDIAIYRIWHRD